MIKAIIFDMDGVISNTQSIHASVESKILKSYGIVISPGEITKKYAGTKDIDMFTEQLEINKKNKNPQELEKEKWETMKIETKNIQPVPDVISCIQLFYNHGFELSVASSSPVFFIKQVLKNLDIEKYFSYITSSDEVKYGKPHPDVFLKTAEKMKKIPSECIVIEDATNGVNGAKSAGMKCVAITTTHTKEDLKSADLIIDSFKNLSIEKIISL